MATTPQEQVRLAAEKGNRANAKVTHAAPKAAAITTTNGWVALMLEEINALLPKSQRVPVTTNNIQNIERMIQGESAGQQGGFLRDNNPLNYDTWGSAHGPAPITAKYGGSIVPKFGIYIAQFPNPIAGAKATAAAIATQSNNSAMLSALRHDAPPALFGGALASSAWSGAGYASARGILGYPPASGGGPVGPAGPLAPTPPGKVNTGVKNAILTWLNTPGHGPKFSKVLEARFLALAPQDRTATLNAVHDELAKERNLSFWGEVTGATSGIVSGVKHTATAVVSDAVAVTHFLSDLTSLSFWKRIGMGALGVALIAGGVAVFLQSTKTVQGIEGKVVP